MRRVAIASVLLTTLGILAACSDAPRSYRLIDPPSYVEVARIDVDDGNARLEVVFQDGAPAFERQFEVKPKEGTQAGDVLADPSGRDLDFVPTNTPGIWQLEPLRLDRERNPLADPTLWQVQD